jgi:hypothetical protein
MFFFLARIREEFESRAAARTLASRERDGDEGVTEDGWPYIVFKDDAGNLRRLIFDMEL